jgi:type VI protein secretion system component VasK
MTSTTESQKPADDGGAQREALGQEAEHWLKRFDTGTRAWSTAYNACVFGALILSAAAALVLKLHAMGDGFPREDIAAVCAMVAAILSTAVATGGFQRKWRANRKARSALQMLKLDLAPNNADFDKIRERLKQILAEQDSGVIGDAG